MIDAHGLEHSNASMEAVALFDQACAELRCFRGNPVQTVDVALATSPDMPMLHALKAWLHLLGTEPGGIAIADAALERTGALDLKPRERAHVEAARHLARARWRQAGRVLEDLSAEVPTDPLALQVGHQIDFLTGDSRMLRDRIARASPHWSREMPAYHAVLGMHAFGLEETGDYAAAETLGRRCVELQAKDAWGWHAVAHVLEMQGRPEEGIDWLRGGTDDWAVDNFFAVHNWWHLALYHLEQGDMEAVLRLVDGPIAGNLSNVVLDLVDVSALLWRLHLLGVDVGTRWAPVADAWQAHGDLSGYAFNACHAMLAFVGAGRAALQDEAIAGLEHAAHAGGDKALFSAIGLRFAQAVRAFGADDPAACAGLLRGIRSDAHRFGGSHAQRDLIDLTLIESARRAGQASLCEALLHERAGRRPRSSLLRLLAHRAGVRVGA